MKSLQAQILERMPEGLIPSQQRAFQSIAIFVGQAEHGNEVKVFELHRQSYGGWAVRIETGTPGDEGTMASIFCRTRRQIFIGERGGLRAFNARGTFVKGRAALLICSE